jgi:glycosyltransferase involved in cell wall biosynthesis
VRVCFLTHYYPPEVGAPQTRIDLLAQTLAAHGAAVTVHTCFPHYPSGVVAAPYRNRPWLIERRGRVRVLRSTVYPAANRGFARRLLDHASFGLSALATARLSGPADVVVAETPPLFTAAAGAAYAALKRAAYVVHVADRWPASAVELGVLRDRRAIAAATALERRVYRRADLILAPTEGIVDSLAQVTEAFGKARRVWPVVDLTRFDPRPSGGSEPLPHTSWPEPQGPREGFGLLSRGLGDGSGPLPHTSGSGPLRLLYAGTVGLAHGLDVLIEAAALAGPQVVQVTIAGDGADADRIGALIRERPVVNVRMLGTVAAERVPELYRHCDASAVLLRDLPIFAGALPTKMLEAMAAGRPLLLSARGESARLLERAGAGIVVPPGDPAALAEVCRRLYSDPAKRRALGEAGRVHAETHFGAQRAAEQWSLRLGEALAARRVARSR